MSAHQGTQQGSKIRAAWLQQPQPTRVQGFGAGASPAWGAASRGPEVQRSKAKQQLGCARIQV